MGKCTGAILSIIDAFETTLNEAKTAESLQDLKRFSDSNKTDMGICWFVWSNYSFDGADELCNFLQLVSRDDYKFEYQQLSTIHNISHHYKKWREIAIKLCEMRIEYLKKFI